MSGTELNKKIFKKRLTNLFFRGIITSSREREVGKMFSLNYIYSHNSLTPLQMISAIAVGVVIGLIIMYFVGRSVK